MAHLRDAAEAQRHRHARAGLKRRTRDVTTAMSKLDERQRKANVRLALILASVALMFGLGFVAKIAWLG